MPRPIHFEIHAGDPKRVQAFYRALFGWQFQAWAGPTDYWVITTGPATGPGINGGLVRLAGQRPRKDRRSMPSSALLTFPKST